MRILAIDYGEKRIGLALSDPLGFTAQGLVTLEHTDRSSAVKSLKRLCEEHEVGEIVVGLPLEMNGQAGFKAKEVLEFVSELKKMIPLTVNTWDERLSTRQVTRLMIQQDLSRKKRKEHQDQLAAILILQTYLETKRKP